MATHDEDLRFAIGGLDLGSIALLWVKAGFAVFPLAPGNKLPLLSKRQGGRGVHDATRDPEQVRAWWTAHPTANIGVSLVGWIVIDIDWRNGAQQGLAALEAAHGPIVNTTMQQLTGKWVAEDGEEFRNIHCLFRLPEGVATLKMGGELATGIDFKTGAGAYVVGAGSWHGSGVQYCWDLEGPQEVLEAPPWLLAGVTKAKIAATGGTANGEPRTGQDGARARATGLAGLIQMGLAGGVGARNQWVTGVMGHLAKMIPYDDGVRSMGELVWRLAQEQPADGKEPYDRGEYEKTVESIITTERSAWPTGRPGANNGYLVSSGTGTIQALCGDKDDDESVELRDWANFDIRALGLSVDDDGHQTWYVEVTVGTSSQVGLLEGGLLGSGRELDRWLAVYGAFVLGAPGDKWARVGANKRIGLYLSSQGAIAHKTVEALGWSREGGGFVCHEGVISREGLGPHKGATPAAILRNWAPFRYGFEGSREIAVAELVEVLGFHDETVAAVFGAWWAACIVKPQVFAAAGVFPIMALEAPSETGKTNGMFAQLIQMNGSTSGGGESTMADLRDRMSAHRSGIVWQDDLSDMEHVFEILRQSAVEGSRSKKGADRHTSESRRMVSPVVLSAEGLAGIRQEKAMLDRVIILNVPSPVGRRSVHGDWPQYDDIMAQRDRWNGMQDLAGWYVQMGLQWWEAEGLATLKECRVGDGRHGWKIGTLRMGARMLGAMTGDDIWAERVDEWCGTQHATGNADRLVLDILPRALREQAKLCGTPRGPAGNPPVYVDAELQVWFCEPAVADWWAREHRYDKRAMQLGSLESIAGQRERLGCGEAVRKNTYRPRRDERRKLEQHRYYLLPADHSATVLDVCGWSEMAEGQGVLGDD